MAETVLKIKVQAEKDFFYIFDETGVYNRETNKYGWGIPNDVLANVTEAVVRVYLPKSSDYVSINVFPSLPNTSNVGYEIAPEDLGLTSFPPGVYRFDYIVYLPSNVVRTQSCNFFYYIPLVCCIGKKKGKTSLTDATSDLSQKVTELELLLENAIWASCYGNINDSQEISDYIESQCDCCC